MKPLKYTYCPICAKRGRSIRLKKSKKDISTYYCPFCKLRISPNRKGSKKQRNQEADFSEINRIIDKAFL